MAFSEIELKKIDQLVGGLCRRRSPAHLKDELSFGYIVEGHDVLVSERRPRWQSPGEWTESGVAKLKYTRKTGLWQLYWQRASLKWVKYDPFPPNRDLAVLVEEADRDPHGCFFG
jgi:hypothetical protein